MHGLIVGVMLRGGDSHIHFHFDFLQVRKVSNEIARTANENITQDQELSLVFMQWGQWVNHDIDLAPSSGAGVSPELHCGCAFEPPCFPIKVPQLSLRPTQSVRIRIESIRIGIDRIRQ